MNSNNNETFKLLEMSDDLKSLSDLELPEIVNQRKRKVRRFVLEFLLKLFKIFLICDFLYLN